MALSDTQLMLLSAASQREDLLITLPAHPKTGAAKSSLSKLLSRGLLEEVAVGREQPHWRTEDDGQRIGLRMTRAGLDAIGLAPEDEPETPESPLGTAESAFSQAAPAVTPSAPCDGSKQALVIALLRRGEGASLAELAAATGWLSHTTRAALTGLRKKGHSLTRERRQDGTSLYRLVGPEA